MNSRLRPAVLRVCARGSAAKRVAIHKNKSTTVAMRARLWEAKRVSRGFFRGGIKEAPSDGTKTKQMFGKYQILRRIATGDMAEILKRKRKASAAFNVALPQGFASPFPKQRICSDAGG